MGFIMFLFSRRVFLIFIFAVLNLQHTGETSRYIDNLFFSNDFLIFISTVSELQPTGETSRYIDIPVQACLCLQRNGFPEQMVSA